MVRGLGWLLALLLMLYFCRMYIGNVVGINIYLAFSLLAIKKLLNMWNVVWRKVLNMLTKCVCSVLSKSACTNEAVMWNLEVMADKCNVFRTLHKWQTPFPGAGILCLRVMNLRYIKESGRPRISIMTMWSQPCWLCLLCKQEKVGHSEYMIIFTCYVFIENVCVFNCVLDL